MTEIKNKYEVLFDDYNKYGNDPKTDTLRIKLNDDRWGGVIYHYNSVSLDVDDLEQPRLSYNYDIDYDPTEKIISGEITESERADLETLLGDVLADVIVEGFLGEDRASNSGDAGPRRGVHSEGNSIS